MNEEQLEKDLQELELYRKIIKESANKKQTWQNKLMEWLGSFIAYGTITLLLWVCWNWSLVKLWPQIPEITPLQMAGLWYLTSVLFKR
jgi:polyferredoxin